MVTKRQGKTLQGQPKYIVKKVEPAQPHAKQRGEQSETARNGGVGKHDFTIDGITVRANTKGEARSKVARLKELRS